MAPLLLRRSTRNRKIDDDGNENGERKGTSANNNSNSNINSKKEKVPPSSKKSTPLAAAETKKKNPPPPHLLHAKKKKKKKKKMKKKAPPPPQPVQVQVLLPEVLLVSHPYMEINYPKRIPTIEQIQRMEESVLLKLIDRSKWRSYPSGPQQCYEKSNTNTINHYLNNNSNSNNNNHNNLTSPPPPPGPSGDVVDGGNRRRITHLKIIDNTFYERLQFILAFRYANRNANNNRNNNNNNNNRQHHHVRQQQQQQQLPRIIIGPRPMWRMTKDIAIMDQLQIIELYRCTGRLPKSMNYLNHLIRLQLDGCRNIDLSLLGLGLGLDDCCDGGGTTTTTTPGSSGGGGGGGAFDNKTTTTTTTTNSNRLRNLIELKITDCEDLTPIKFQNLSNLKRISLMRWDKSNSNTVNLGNRWINELSLAVTTTTETSTTTPTAATTSLVASSSSSSSMNENNNSNNVTLPMDEQQQQQQQPVVPVPVQALRFKFQFRFSLQFLTFSGSRLTNKDLRNILFCMLYDNKFPNLHTLVINDNPGINSFMEVLQLPSPYNAVPMPTMATNLKTIKLSGTRIKVNNEELDSVIYFLEKLYPTVGTMKVFRYGSCKGKDGVVSFRENSPSITHIHNKRMILLPSDQRKRINKIEYLLSMNSINAFSMTGGGSGRRGDGTRNTTISDGGAAVAADAAAAADADNTGNEDGRNPLRSSEEVGASASASASTTDHNQGGGVRQRPETIPLSVWPLAIFKAFRKSYRTCNQDSDIRDEDTFRKETRYDIVYHLLRNGPIFASGQTVRYKRKREYYPRGVKKQIKFTK
jgi:hypothetical protein